MKSKSLVSINDLSREKILSLLETAEKFEKNHLKLEWNDEWLLKASNPLMRRNNSLVRRNNLMTNQVRIMFGGVDTDLDTFIAQSQTIQAEANCSARASSRGSTDSSGGTCVTVGRSSRMLWLTTMAAKSRPIMR